MTTCISSFRTMALALGLIVSESVIAAPAVVHQFGPNGTVIGVNGLVAIEPAMAEPGDNCAQRIAEVVVDEVVYEGVSDMIAGFRAKKPGPNEWYGLFRMDTKAIYSALPNAAQPAVQRLVSKGARLVVVYQVCGSGGFVSVRDIFKKSAVNNP